MQRQARNNLVAEVRRLPRLPMLRPLRHRSFALLWTAQTLGTLGAAGASIATAWQVLSMRGSAADLGLLVGLLTLANLLLLPVAGLVADRFPRERLLFLAAMATALSSLGIGGLIRFDLLQIWHLYPLAVFFGAVGAFRAPAALAIYPTVVPKDELLQANALRSASVHLIGAVGAGLGGLLVDLWGTAGAFAFQGALGGLSGLCLLGVRPSFVVEGSSVMQRGPWWQSFGEGIAVVRRLPWVWGTIVLFMVGDAFAAAALNVAIPVRIREDLKMDAVVLGTMNSAGATGSLLLAVVLGQARSVPRGGTVAFLGIVVAGIALAAYAFLDTFPELLGASFVGWAGLAVFMLIWNSTLQRKIPAPLLGRVSSVDNFGSLLLVPVGVPLLGVAVARFGAADVLLGCGLVVVGLATLALALPAVRRWE